LIQIPQAKFFKQVSKLERTRICKVALVEVEAEVAAIRISIIKERPLLENKLLLEKLSLTQWEEVQVEAQTARNLVKRNSMLFSRT
jgi:hypothetical protein